MIYNATHSLVFAYAKGSPLLAKYIELNRVIGVQVWREWFGDGQERNTVALVCKSGQGFPEDLRLSLIEAKAFAKAISAHSGLPVLADC